MRSLDYTGFIPHYEYTNLERVNYEEVKNYVEYAKLNKNFASNLTKIFNNGDAYYNYAYLEDVEKKNQEYEEEQKIRSLLRTLPKK